MTDSELLERAAKAAGLWDFKNGCIDIPWSPLTGDGDALRLAVKLGFCVAVDSYYVVVTDQDARQAKVPKGSDPCAATRRAIVNAAARLGGGKP